MYSAKDMVQIAMFTAILAVLSILQIPVPSGVPFTLQTFAVALCGYLLGVKKGTLTLVIYLLIGSMGLPVFTGLKGGIGVLAGPTGGFLLGFIGQAVLCGYGVTAKTKRGGVLFGILGVLFCHLCGVLWFAVLMHQNLVSSFFLVSVPYLIKDFLSVAGAYFGAGLLRKRMTEAGIL